MAMAIDVDEQCLTVAEVAERLNLDRETVRRLFLHEPGVLVICAPRKGRRIYRTLRIPQSVYRRVVTRFTRLP
jgi:excisionase family DNA binding protein